MTHRLITVATFAAALAFTAGASAQIAQWNFNGTSATTVPGGTASPTPSVGAGTASLIGGTTASFASGTANGGSTDPVTTTPNNYGWGTTTYALQNAENGLRGVQFNVSTVGFSNIVVSWDQRASNTSSRYFQFQYTLDVTSATPTWVAFGGQTINSVDGVFVRNAGDTWFNNNSVNLSSILGANENPNFAFRIVAIFDPNTGTGYAAASTSYAPTGTARFDMVTVVPAPGAAAVMGLAGLCAMRRRR